MNQFGQCLQLPDSPQPQLVTDFNIGYQDSCKQLHLRFPPPQNLSLQLFFLPLLPSQKATGPSLHRWMPSLWPCPHHLARPGVLSLVSFSLLLILLSILQKRPLLALASLLLLLPSHFLRLTSWSGTSFPPPPPSLILKSDLICALPLSPQLLLGSSAPSC